MPDNLAPHDSLLVDHLTIPVLQDEINPVLFDFNPYASISVVNFVKMNFLELIFNLDETGFIYNFNSIVSNESFFHLIKNIFKHKNFVLSAIDSIDVKDRYRRGQLRDFFEKLFECQSFEDFELVDKDKKVILHIILFIKKTYLI